MQPPFLLVMCCIIFVLFIGGGVFACKGSNTW